MKSETLTQEDLKILKAPFPRESLGVKVQCTSKDRTRALLVLYLQHTDVQDRLDQVDPAWTSEVLQESRSEDVVYVRLRLTMKGVARENVGEGGDPKAAYSDALKRSAMLFGVGRYLYDSPTVWADYNEQRDRFRQWSIEDYDRAAEAHGLPRAHRHEPSARMVTEALDEAVRKANDEAGPGAGAEQKSSPAPQSSTQAQEPTGEARKIRPKAKPGREAPGLTTQQSATPATSRNVRPREQLNRILMSIYRPYLEKFPETQFMNLLSERYGVGETRLMSVEQLDDLVRFMEQRMTAAA